MWAAQVNGMDPADFNQRLAVLRQSLEKHVDTAGVLSADSDTIRQEHDVNVFYLMTNKTLCQRSAVIFGCWFLLFGVFYKLTTGDLLAGNLVARTLLLLLRMPGLVGDVFILGRIGRRKSLVASMLALSAGTAALSVALVFFVDEAWLARSLIVLNLLLFDLSAVTVFTYSAELYPTVLRGAGLGLCYSCGRVGALLTPFFNDMMSLVAKGMLYALYAAVLFVFGLLATQLPETTQLQPANTLRDLHAKKWKLSSPLRVARRRSGAAKSTTKLSITVSKRRNRRMSCAQPQ
ncbi:hypothetical protein HPB48_012203 [Haemaphysalis longicornis]|uniref:Uncharacterized protein n=1 Tax=Haemaphysalis longicornis TaxID=44386 RepID=A0A9J6FS10_HAELO|nr:hypothetical protein HPB48_012203 [Haemaphysalis longicornis]